MSEELEAVEESSCADVEDVQDIVRGLVSLISSAQRSSESSSHLDEISTPPECRGNFSALQLDCTVETADQVAASCDTVSDPLIGQAESIDRTAKQSELSGRTDSAECDSEQSRQLSTAAVDDENQLVSDPVLPPAETDPFGGKNSDDQLGSGLEIQQDTSTGMPDNGDEIEIGPSRVELGVDQHWDDDSCGFVAQAEADDESVGVQECKMSEDISCSDLAISSDEHLEQQRGVGSSRQVVQETAEEDCVQSCAEDGSQVVVHQTAEEDSVQSCAEDGSQVVVHQTAEEDSVQSCAEDGSQVHQTAEEDSMQSCAEDGSQVVVHRTAEEDSVQSSAEDGSQVVRDYQETVYRPFGSHLQQSVSDCRLVVQECAEDRSVGMQDSCDVSQQISYHEPDNRRPFGNHSEQNAGGSSCALIAVQQGVEDESLGVRDSGEESQQLSYGEVDSRSQSPMSFTVQLNEDSECSLQSLPPAERGRGPTNFSMKLSGLVRAGES